MTLTERIADPPTAVRRIEAAEALVAEQHWGSWWNRGFSAVLR
jgi:hypothetical protein